MDNLVIRHMPELYEDNDTMKVLCNIEKGEFTLLATARDEIINNNFINSASENGVRRYEVIYRVPLDSTLSVEERREQIKNKIIWVPPYTRQRFQDILFNLYGEGNYIFEVKPEEYTVIIDISTANPNIYLQFNKDIRRILPANMYMIIAIQYTHLYLLRHFNYGQMEQFTYGELSKHNKGEEF